MSYTRRGFLGSAAAVAVVSAVGPRWVFGQDTPVPALVAQARAAAATAKITTQTLRGGVSALIGSGGNIVVLPGKQGKVLVDSGISTSKPQIMEALAALSGDPMTHLIDTHWHYDHTDGNEWMHAAGATIVSSEKCKVRLSTQQTIAAFGAVFAPDPVGARPTVTFAEKKTLKLNGETIEMVHYAPAHTDTDISVHFTHADVLHTGDTWFNGFYPFIDYATGGSIDGMIAAADTNLKTAGASTMIVPGHGPVGDKAQLAEYRDVIAAIRSKVADMKKSGKTLAEVVAAGPTAGYDAKWGVGFVKPEMFVGLVYQGV